MSIEDDLLNARRGAVRRVMMAALDAAREETTKSNRSGLGIHTGPLTQRCVSGPARTGEGGVSHMRAALPDTRRSSP